VIKDDEVVKFSTTPRIRVEGVGEEQFRVQISNRIAALEEFETGVDINSAWETIKNNIKISTKEILCYNN
jgi:hypothetical protein